MKVLLFGATGMIGQGVLRECLLAPDVEEVLAVGRHATGQHHAKLQEVAHADLFDLSALASRLSGFDACFFCLGVTSAGMAEEAYRRVTFDLTLGIARLLAPRNPGMVFVYVSGMGTDSTGTGRVMWARVKGATENALLAMPFRAAYMLRPAIIQPMHGIRSRTGWYQALYGITGPLLPLLRRWFPGYVTTTEEMGKAMLEVVRRGAPTHVLENRDINEVAGRRPAQR